jgi:hypothetical protein
MNLRQVSDALHRLAGTPRLLIYDVPETDAPARSDPCSPFVRGGPAWNRFVERRRALDDGRDLNLLVSLRGLRADERLMMVGWGTNFANSFLVIEPYDPWLDLTTPESIAQYAKEQDAKTPDALIRAAYAEWVYWVSEDNGQIESRTATLQVHDPNATLWTSVWEQLPKTWSEADFLSTLTLLNLREQELFVGGREVMRAMIPFLTRLGLPILYDWRLVMHGMRELINAGLASAQDPENRRVYRGPMYRLPEEISDERLAFMLR